MSAAPPTSIAVPISAGVVTAIVGFTSSFAVYLAGLRAVGADAEQAASGLFALTVGFGLAIIALALWFRIPITLAWSTPGAALLVSTGAVEGGWAAAVGAFALVGLLIALTGFVPPLARLVEAIPTAIAQAMLAGVLLPLVIAPAQTAAEVPLLAAPVLLTWLVGLRFFPRWAVPAAMGVAFVVIGIELLRTDTTLHPVGGSFAPTLTWTTPSLSVPAVVGIAIPLYLVTMAAQNVPGSAVLRSFGYPVPWRSALAVTGLGTAAAAPFGGQAMNLAAISAALAAGEDAGPDRDRRWIAAVSAGATYLVLALGSGLVTAVTAAAPGGLVEGVAGLALIGAFAGALVAAIGNADAAGRTVAGVTFVVAASGISILGVGAAFWALVVGMLVRLVLTPRDPGFDKV